MSDRQKMIRGMRNPTYGRSTDVDLLGALKTF